MCNAVEIQCGTSKKNGQAHQATTEKKKYEKKQDSGKEIEEAKCNAK